MRATDGGSQDSIPVGDFVERLIDDGKAYAQAEIHLARARAEAKVAEYRTAALLGLGAAAMALTALITLFVTIALALATVIGPLAGGLIATVVAAATASALGYSAWKAIKS
jgi:hypothetical protein